MFRSNIVLSMQALCFVMFLFNRNDIIRFQCIYTFLANRDLYLNESLGKS